MYDYPRSMIIRNQFAANRDGHAVMMAVFFIPRRVFIIPNT